MLKYSSRLKSYRIRKCRHLSATLKNFDNSQFIFCFLLRFEEEQVKIFIGDQKNRTFLRELRSKLPKLDILIDDGGHTMEQQKRTFEELFGHVTNDGGVYWCEDLHTSYWKEMFDGPKNAPPFVDIAKTWVDLLNAHHSRGKFKPNDITEHARGIHFYDSVVVIEKQPRRNVKAVTFAR